MPFTDDDEIMPLLPGVYSNAASDLELAEPPPAYVASSHRAVPEILPAYASSSREAEEVELPPYVPHSHYQYSSLATQNRVTQAASKPAISPAPRPTVKTTGVYINGPRASRALRTSERRRGCPCYCGMPSMPWFLIFVLFFAFVIQPVLVIGLPLLLPHHKGRKPNGNG